MLDDTPRRLWFGVVVTDGQTGGLYQTRIWPLCIYDRSYCRYSSVNIKYLPRANQHALDI